MRWSPLAFVLTYVPAFGTTQGVCVNELTDEALGLVRTVFQKKINKQHANYEVIEQKQNLSVGEGGAQ